MENDVFIEQAKELKAIAVYSQEVNLRDAKEAQNLYSYVIEKNLFKSRYAGPIKGRLEELSQGRPGDYSCIICKKGYAENGIICDKCMSLVLEGTAEATASNKKEDKSKKNPQDNSNDIKPNFKSKIIAAAAAFLAVAAAVFIFKNIDADGLKGLNKSDDSGELTAFFEDNGVKDTIEKGDSITADTENENPLFIEAAKDDGGFIGYDESGNVIYIEIKGDEESDKTIAGIKQGDSAHYAAEMLEQSGAKPDMAAQQYWAEYYYNEGRIDTFALVYSQQVPDSEEKIVYMVTIEKDKVVAVSAEKKKR